jgi:hypothetical protein
MRLQILYDVGVNTLGYAEYVFGGKTTACTLFLEL